MGLINVLQAGGVRGRVWDLWWVEGGGKEVREEFMKTEYVGNYFSRCPALNGSEFHSPGV